MEQENNYFKLKIDPHNLKIHQKRLGAVAIPVNDEEQYLLIKVIRFDKTYYEFPRGFEAEQESFEDAAIRELEEETGVITKKATLIGTVMPDSEILDAENGIVECKVPEFSGFALQDNEGVQDVKICRLADLLRLVRQHKIIDSYTLAAIDHLVANQFNDDLI